MKILAIDDREDNLVAVTAMLQNYVADCEVKTATTGMAGLQLALTFQPDTILLDIQMPGLDGFQVCQLLKNYSVTRHIPIIFLTAQKPDAATQVRGLGLGADGFISKPVEAIALAAQVRAMVRIKVAEDALRADKQSLERAVAERTAALQAETTKLDAIFDSSPVAMLVLDEKMSVVRYNAAAAALATGNLAVAMPTVVGQGSGRAASAAGSAAPHPGGGQSLSNDSGLIGETPLPQAQHGSAGASPYHQLNGNSLVPTPPPQPGDALCCVHRTENPQGCGYAPDCRFCPLRQGVESVLAGGAAVHGAELAMDLLRDGRPQKVWLRVGTEPILIAGLRHVVVALDDITERKQAEAALRENEERHRYILQTAMDGFWLTDLEGRLLEVNETYCRMSGYSSPELLALRVTDLEATEAAADTAAHLQNVRAQGEDRFETRHRRKDGSVFAVEISVQYQPADGGRFVAFLRDITERQRAAAALTHSHDLMRYIIEHNRSAIAVHDRDLKYVYVSQRYLQDYQVKEKDVIGKHHYEVFPDLPQKWRAVHQKALAGEISRAEDDPYVRADGTVDWTRWECRPWYEADGSIGGIIIYTEVITERKRAEEALRQQAEELRVRNDRLNRFNQVAVGRELRMIELKREVNELCGKLGETPRHRIVETAPTPPAAPETQV
jgi:PAS domain S-box-containing protein